MKIYKFDKKLVEQVGSSDREWAIEIHGRYCLMNGKDDCGHIGIYTVKKEWCREIIVTSADYTEIMKAINEYR